MITCGGARNPTLAEGALQSAFALDCLALRFPSGRGGISRLRLTGRHILELCEDVLVGRSTDAHISAMCSSRVDSSWRSRSRVTMSSKTRLLA